MSHIRDVDLPCVQEMNECPRERLFLIIETANVRLWNTDGERQWGALLGHADTCSVILACFE